MNGERAHDQSHESSQFQASGLYRRYGETMVVPWNEWAACFKNMGEKGDSIALKYWNESHGQFRLSGAPSSTNFAKRIWDTMTATSVASLIKRFERTSSVRNEYDDSNPTRTPTPEEQKIAKNATDEMKEKNLSPAERALLTAVENARTVDQLLNAIDAAITAKVEAYPKGSRQKLTAIKQVLTKLKDAEKTSMEEATAVWNAVSKYLPTEIRNGFQFEPMTPDGKPMLRRKGSGP